MQPDDAAHAAIVDQTQKRVCARLLDRVDYLCQQHWDINLALLCQSDARAIAELPQSGATAGLAEGFNALADLLAGDPSLQPAVIAELAASAQQLRDSLPASWSITTPPEIADELAQLDPGAAFDGSDDFANYNGFDTDSALVLDHFSPLDGATLNLADPDPAPTSSMDHPQGSASAPQAFDQAPAWELNLEDAGHMASSKRGATELVESRRFDTASGGGSERITPALEEPLEFELSGIEFAAARGAPAYASPASAPTRSAYLLCVDQAISRSYSSALAAAGFEVHDFDQAEELIETIGALVPELVLIAADGFTHLDAVAAAVARARRRANAPILLLTVCGDGAIAHRLAAMRAGADAFFAEPVAPTTVVERLADLQGADNSDPYRVLIVEDERSQALFAESILRKAGMQSQVVHEALAALDALESFRPDLVLMDLRMPGCNGIELTTLIREREQFIDVPIVFLSGEMDAERRFEALAVGGDDFLEKPIKPRYLLSAVSNRVRRARALARRARPTTALAPAARLSDRERFIERIGESLGQGTPETPGGLLFVTVDGKRLIRERLGLIAFDQAMQQVGRMLAEALPDGTSAARFGDTSFAVLAPNLDATELDALAQRIEGLFTANLIDSPGGSLALVPLIGGARFAQGWRDAAAILNGVERTAALARDERGARWRMSAGPSGAQAADPDVEIRNTVRAALDAGGMQLLFQPIVSLKGERQPIYQVLLRIKDSQGRRLAAAEIIPMAERHNLVHEIDRAVVLRALDALAAVREQQPDTVLLLSQSAHAIKDPERIDWIASQADARGVPRASVALEFRHDDVFARVREARVWFEAVRAAQLRSALSAFEPSATAFDSLPHLPLDFLRVSGAFVMRLNAERIKLLSELADAAHRQQMRLVAPMVEDARTAALVWGTGVDYVQGDFIHSATAEMNFDFRAAAF